MKFLALFGFLWWIGGIMIAILGIIGYVLNIIYILHLHFDGHGAAGIQILRIVGLVVFPLGGIMGWIHG